MSCVNNKSARKKSHAQILSEIAAELHIYLKDYPDALLVREEALAMISRSAKTLQTLHKVVGVADLYGWACGHRIWEEIHPKTIKAVVAGDKNAEKEAVAAGLAPYVGKLDYETDDESDAVAVGIAWLIKQNLLRERDL